MSDAFNDAGKLRQELADVWPMLRSAEADNTRLRAEIDRLREAVQYAVDNFDLPDGEYSGLEREAIRRLKAALAGTAVQPSPAHVLFRICQHCNQEYVLREEECPVTVGAWSVIKCPHCGESDHPWIRLAERASDNGPTPQPNAAPDTERLDFLQRWVWDAKRRGFVWDTFTFETSKPVRAQLDAQMAAGMREPPKHGTTDNGTSQPSPALNDFQTTAKGG